jgi:two-component system sensor histidine kinase MprB
MTRLSRHLVARREKTVRRLSRPRMNWWTRRIAMVSFRRRVIWLSAAAVAVAVLLSSGMAFYLVRGELRGEVDDQLRELVREIVVPQGQGVIVLPPDPLKRTANYAQVVQPSGNVIRPRGSTVSVPVDARTIKATTGSIGPYFEDKTINHVHVRVYTAPLPASSGGAIQTVRSLEEVDTSLRNMGIALALVSLAGIALAVWLGRMVARTALRPVGQLTEAAEHVARTRDLTRRMDTSGKDELSRLGASFNTMLEALEESQKAQRQLVADASHELRTPLTSLRTNIEVLADAGGLSQEDRESLRRDVIGQLDELSVLITDLVDLARGVEPELEMEDMRLDTLVADAVDRARRHAPDKRFATDLERTLVVGVPARLDRAVSNLLDNASKWSSPGGSIEVVLRDGELTVRDYGPGIDPDDLPHIFNRFYRAPSARGLPGSGLGLAIVRQVAELHGGSVSAERPRAGGTRFRLRIPT